MTGITSFLQHLRFAVRSLRSAPIFTLTAILSLAVAIGGNTAIFTVVRAVLLEPLSYRDSSQLVHISGGATPTRYREMRASARSFAGIGAYTNQENVTLARKSEPEVLKAVLISAGFDQILGVSPVAGRTFRADEDRAGGVPVAMISAELWRRDFGENPEIVGTTAEIAATAYTIVGVLPPRFQFPYRGIDVWLTAPADWSAIPAKSRELSPYLTLFGRLKPGVTLEQANAELKVVRQQYASAHPAMLDANKKPPVELTRMKDDLVANVRTMLWILFGAVGFVLLTACANVASLLLARATARSREFAIRSALGAGRGRLAGQLLAESVLLSLAGGALGVAFAVGVLRALPHFTALDLPRASEIHVDWVVLAFACAVSIGTGVVFGLSPSISASRPDLMSVLRASGRAAGRSRFAGFNTRAILSAGQVSLSIVLLIGAALLMESIYRMRQINLGFDAHHVLTCQIALPPARYDTPRKVGQFFHDVVQQADSLPGVEAAASAWTLPMMGFAATPVQNAAKPLLRLNERPFAKIMPVSPGYFRTLKIALRRGREFNDADNADAPRVVIINEALARRFWPSYPTGQDPVGQHLLVGGVNLKPAEIAGVVADERQSLDGNVWPDTLYEPFLQNPQPSSIIALRTAGNPLSFTRSVQDLVQRLDQDQGIAEVRTMEDLVEAETGQRRVLLILLGSFAAMALLLAVIGIYGIVAYSAAQRTQEMGIRRALGASAGDILVLVMGQALGLAGIGIAAGLCGALTLTRVMKSLLYGVSATDPATFAAMAALFLLVALAASYVPGRRAARIDPMAALRV